MTYTVESARRELRGEHTHVLSPARVCPGHARRHRMPWAYPIDPGEPPCEMCAQARADYERWAITRLRMLRAAIDEQLGFIRDRRAGE